MYIITQPISSKLCQQSTRFNMYTIISKHREKAINRGEILRA